MRGPVESLPTPHPLGLQLPPIYHEDNLLQRFTAGLDEALAPVFNALDNLDAYLDPAVAPPDFLEWLASWVGASMDETWSLERRRSMVGQAADLYGMRGTVRGLRDHLALFVEGEVDIVETGGAAWSPTPGGAVPGSVVPNLRVRIRVPDPGGVDARRLEAVVAASKPANVPHQIEVVRQ